MPENIDLPQVRIGGLALSPPLPPADSSTQDQLAKLWAYGRDFIVMSGPPGVGKTRAAEDYVFEVLRTLGSGSTPAECRLSHLFPEFRSRVYTTQEIDATLAERHIDFVWDLTVLHPQYSYEDLIRGYRMVGQGGNSGLAIREGVLAFISRVSERIDSQWRNVPTGLLVLDEINRAPIGQLFGEALYAIDRRGEKVTTPYELPGFDSTVTVPASLLLLGTMNSVDRATSGFDFALRRRITFMSLAPSSVSIEERFRSIHSTVAMAAVGLFALMRQVVEGAVQQGVVPRADLVLGQAFFLPPATVRDQDEAFAWLASSMKYRVLPTLLDYHEQGLLSFQDGVIPHLDDLISGTKSLAQIDETEMRGWIEAIAPSGLSETVSS